MDRKQHSYNLRTGVFLRSDVVDSFRENETIEENADPMKNIICCNNIEADSRLVKCNGCNKWEHLECRGLTVMHWVIFSSSNESYFCKSCKPDFDPFLLKSYTSTVNPNLDKIIAAFQVTVTQSLQQNNENLQEKLQQNIRSSDCYM